MLTLLKLFSTIPDDSNGDLLGKIYEFFLGKFGLEEAQKGGEFFTPTSVVKLMVEFIEPYHGKLFDPACGSGGMFVQSNNFIRQHHLQKGSVSPISVYGQEKSIVKSILKIKSIHEIFILLLPFCHDSTCVFNVFTVAL